MTTTLYPVKKQFRLPVNSLVSSNLGAVWSAVSGTLRPASVEGVNGNKIAYRYTEDTSNNDHYFTQVYAKASSSIPYKISMFVKKVPESVARQFCFFIFGTGYAGGASCGWDINTLTVSTAASTYGSFSAASTRQLHVGNGWYLCELSFTSDTTNSLIINLSFRSGTTSPYLGDGISGGFFCHPVLI
jgi:hypothetical protein